MIKRHGHRGENPCITVDQFREESRERFMTADELKRFFKAVDELKKTAHRDFFKILVFTGARKRNVQQMQWGELDLADDATWTIPSEKSKNKKPLTVVLSTDAIAILKRRKASADGSKWVFPGRTDAGHIGKCQSTWENLVKSAEIDNLRVHDLRRTMGSVLAQTGHSLHLIAAVLGHQGTKATAVYARFATENLRNAVDQAGEILRGVK